MLPPGSTIRLGKPFASRRPLARDVVSSVFRVNSAIIGGQKGAMKSSQQERRRSTPLLEDDQQLRRCPFACSNARASPAGAREVQPVGENPLTSLFLIPARAIVIVTADPPSTEIESLGFGNGFRFASYQCQERLRSCPELRHSMQIRLIDNSFKLPPYGSVICRQLIDGPLACYSLVRSFTVNRLWFGVYCINICGAVRRKGRALRSLRWPYVTVVIKGARRFKPVEMLRSLPKGVDDVSPLVTVAHKTRITLLAWIGVS
uniref:Uncharacterized protein n=1 Tax=Steinernema glaseri TaxID=37863 RepID=A0A1I8AMH7_9BILA